MIGSRLAHYDITTHLGTGGMGEVYQGTDTKLGRSVAIIYAERTKKPHRVTLLIAPESARSGGTTAFLLVVTDSAGAPVYDPPPLIEPLTTGTSVRSVDYVDFEAPFTWLVQMQLAPDPGVNQFKVKVGELERVIQVRGR